jgi:hypothetical protein
MDSYLIMNTTTVLLTAVVIAAGLVIAATASNSSEVLAYRHSNHHSHHHHHNHKSHANHQSSQSSSASIGQENNQRAVCISGGNIGTSCNQLGVNSNSGNAVAANVGGGSGSGHHGSQSANARIGQENNQRAVCISGGNTGASCNQIGLNGNLGNALAANVR